MRKTPHTSPARSTTPRPATPWREGWGGGGVFSKVFRKRVWVCVGGGRRSRTFRTRLAIYLHTHTHTLTHSLTHSPPRMFLPKGYKTRTLRSHSTTNSTKREKLFFFLISPPSRSKRHYATIGSVVLQNVMRITWWKPPKTMKMTVVAWCALLILNESTSWHAERDMRILQSPTLTDKLSLMPSQV